MTDRPSFASLLLALACAPACGGQSVASEQEAGPSGPSATGGQSSGGGAGNKACRTYATRYRTLAGTETTCDFDRASLSLRCATSARATTLTTWESIDAVIGDNEPIGRFTHSTYLYEGPACTFQNTLTYDALGRPLQDVAAAAPEATCGNRGATYLSWDDDGRALTAEGNSVGSLACRGQTQRHTYDDGARRLEIATAGGSGDFCHDVVYTYSYDDDALPLAVSIVVDGSARAPIEYVTLETAEICR
jgi:hypothetical protein